MTDRMRARELADEFLAQNKPLDWFDVLYQEAKGDSSQIPWADMQVNPNVAGCREEILPLKPNSSALVVGCGLGDDAEYLSELGYNVTAFDISKTAIGWCRQRFPQSKVEYVEADLLSLPADWNGRFDFVLESYTLQAVPDDLRPKGIESIARMSAGDGRILVIARGRDPEDAKGQMPWPLLRQEMSDFCRYGLREIRFDDYMEDETPPVRRFRSMFQRL
jgi:ubiquinone/menaquinone biosynthesis C-methylase UbiE